jgi:hypothetical protein
MKSFKDSENDDDPLKDEDDITIPSKAEKSQPAKATGQGGRSGTISLEQFNNAQKTNNKPANTINNITTVSSDSKPTTSKNPENAAKDMKSFKDSENDDDPLKDEDDITIPSKAEKSQPAKATGQGGRSGTISLEQFNNAQKTNNKPANTINNITTVSSDSKPTTSKNPENAAKDMKSFKDSENDDDPFKDEDDITIPSKAEKSVPSNATPARGAGRSGTISLEQFNNQMANKPANTNDTNNNASNSTNTPSVRAGTEEYEKKKASAPSRKPGDGLKEAREVCV